MPNQAVFAEAYPPLTRAQAVVEANRCYFCHDAPCVQACPTGIDIPGFIRAIATGNMAGAAYKILEQNIFGGSCARVCPTEILCEHECVRNTQQSEPIDIGALQRVATDWQMARHTQPFSRASPTGKRIAVVGAGPAGLSCAHALALRGHDIIVYEAKPKPGGLNEYGIAAYKLTKNFAAREVDFIISIGGISIEYGHRLGANLHLEDLTQQFDAVFLGIGLTGARRLNIEGETLPHVRDAIDFIAELRQTPDPATLQTGRHVVVIGGGNTAIDAATQAKLLGAETSTILYRGTPEKMSATKAEQDFAQTHGVTIRFHAAPVRVEPAAVITERDIFPADLVLVAIGQTCAERGFELQNGKLATTNYQTTNAKIFAGGDCTAGPDLTVQAVQDGKLAARAIHEFLHP